MAIQVHFANLHCNETEDAGADACVLKWNDQTIWSGPMKGGRTRNTNNFQLFPPGKSSAFVSLIDEDWPDEDDHLGSQLIRKDEVGRGWRRAYFRSDEADYFVDYEVFNA
ncbi:hypothetical protein [Rhodococcus sp. IEGM 1307]|uniref:hypothetical protein n=1 Tax=Rhodococcus sp. IEGM 1307 TaxID=3047091 RepID=UPI0024B7EDD7|nr:hypothetical protein [Rhodococcus sp. IEGM 1307]MDI9980039.1 hypothetical protein [Rhodococcus sp. IEGM 1307]